jgi:hypothetical protein
MNLRPLPLLVLSMFAAVALVGCPAPEENTKGGVFAEIAPSAADVKLSTPTRTTTAAAGAGTDAVSATPPGVELADNGANGLATFYTFTRQTFDGVNIGTAWVLGLVNAITKYPTTERSDDQAVWGPWRGELSPAEWRLRVSRAEGDAYDYVLEGRTAGQGEYRAVISGRGYAPGDSRRGLGNFVIDNDAADAIDPARLKSPDSSGTLSVDHDLRAVRTNLDAAYHISVKARPTATEEDYDIELDRLDGGGGTVEIASKSDIDHEPAKAALENVSMKSRWIASGAGRADVTVEGGDLPASIGSITMSECWAESFKEVYYTDSANLAPTSGDEAACPP